MNPLSVSVNKEVILCFVVLKACEDLNYCSFWLGFHTTIVHNTIFIIKPQCGNMLIYSMTSHILCWLLFHIYFGIEMIPAFGNRIAFMFSKLLFNKLKLQSVSFASLSPSLFKNLELQPCAELSCLCWLYSGTASAWINLFWGECVAVSHRTGVDVYCSSQSQILAYVLEYMTQIRIFTV